MCLLTHLQCAQHQHKEIGPHTGHWRKAGRTQVLTTWETKRQRKLWYCSLSLSLYLTLSLCLCLAAVRLPMWEAPETPGTLQTTVGLDTGKGGSADSGDAQAVPSHLGDLLSAAPSPWP